LRREGPEVLESGTTKQGLEKEHRKAGPTKLTNLRAEGNCTSLDRAVHCQNNGLNEISLTDVPGRCMPGGKNPKKGGISERKKLRMKEQTHCKR